MIHAYDGRINKGIAWAASQIPGAARGRRRVVLSGRDLWLGGGAAGPHDG